MIDESTPPRLDHLISEIKLRLIEKILGMNPDEALEAYRVITKGDGR